jgi:hypothetical protein
MDLLDELPYYEEEGGEKKKKRYSDSESDGELKQKRKKKTKIDTGYDGNKMTPLGLRLDQDLFEIKGIRNKELPKADGTEWTTNERLAAKNRPYGKQYINDQKTRLMILEQDPNYKFISELAGALRKGVYQLYDEEDMESILREREREKLQTKLDMERTLITMREKNEQIKNLKLLLDSINIEIEKYQTSPANRELTLLSRNLIDDDTQKSSKLLSVTFQDLNISLDRYAKAFDEFDSDQTEKIINDYLYEMENEYVSFQFDKVTNENREIFYTVLLYFMTFLDKDLNDAANQFYDSIKRKIDFLFDDAREYRERGGVTDRDINDLFADLESLRKNEQTSRERSNIVDWEKSIFTKTETVNMYYFYRLNIKEELERKMVTFGCQKIYGSGSRIYVEKIIAFIYAQTPEEEQALQKGSDGLGLRFMSNAKATGHPLKIAQLLKLELPDLFNRDVDLPKDWEKTVKELVKSHFLFLFFTEQDFGDVVKVFQESYAFITDPIQQIFKPFVRLFERLEKFYKIVIFEYIIAIDDYFTNTMKGVVSLPNEIRKLLLKPANKNQPFVTTTGGGGGKEDNAILFTKTDEAFKKIDIKNSVIDKPFLYYLRTNRHLFVSAIEPDEEDEDDTMKSDASSSIKLNDKDYPLLQLHYLYRAFIDYRDKRLDFLEKKLGIVTRAIDKATIKLAKVVGSEQMDSSKKHFNSDYVQRKSFVMQPINSGIVKLKPEITTMIRRAYHKVQKYCQGLKGLPLEGFHSPQAYETGLTSDFVEYIAVLSSFNETRFPDTYKSQMQYQSIRLDLHDTMRAMQKYRFTRLSQTKFKIFVANDDDYSPACFSYDRDQYFGGNNRNMITMF